MNTKEIASRLVALCREGEFEKAQKELFAKDAVSIEPVGAPGPQSVKGLEEIIKKGEEFRGSIEELHSASASGPIVAGNHFAITITLDATFKGMGRMTMDEVAVYEVKDGKVVKEQFFYAV